jgi:hypothetical protein
VFGSSYNNGTPQTAEDGKYYTYASGEETLAEGAYSNGYYASGYDSGTIDTTANYGVPQSVENGKYYTYYSGSAQIAGGAYSNYYFNGGAIDTNYGSTTPQTAEDGKYYTYSGGTASPATGNNDDGYAYSSGDRVAMVWTVTDDSNSGYLYTAVDASITSSAALVYSSAALTTSTYSGLFKYNDTYYYTDADFHPRTYREWTIYTIAENGQPSNINPITVYTEANGTPEGNLIYSTPSLDNNYSIGMFAFEGVVYYYQQWPTPQNPVVANGAYMSGYYSNGTLDTGYSTTDSNMPIQAINGGGSYYAYNLGTSGLASGCYGGVNYTAGGVDGTC